MRTPIGFLFLVAIGIWLLPFVRSWGNDVSGND